LPVKDCNYYFRNFEFYWQCPKCRHHAPAKVSDRYIKSSKGIRLLRWNPEDVDIRYNDLNGEYTYYYEIPVQLKNDIIMGKKHIVEEVPQVFIDALRKRKAVVFSKDNIFHFKRPTLAGQDRGWGTPLLLPVLKDAFYLQILKKSQEAIALEHIVPLRVLFPQAGSATSDPYCVSHDTLVETREGLRPAGEVGKGSYLKSHTGRWRLVEESVDRPIENGEDVYKFTVAGLGAFPFKISEDHPLFGVKRPSRFRGYDSLGEPDWIEASKVEEGDFVCYPTRRATWKSLELDLHDFCPDRAVTENHIYRRLNQSAAEMYEYFEQNGVPSFDHGKRKRFLSEMEWFEADYENAVCTFRQGSVDRRCRFVEVTQDLAYLIGAYAAEGSPKGTLASFALHANEGKFMDRLDACVEVLGFNPSSRSFRGNSATYEINDVFLAALLTGSCGRGAQNKHFPRYILEAPLEIANDAVSATFEGDGCSFSTKTRRAGLKTTSPQLAMDVRSIILSSGMIPTVQKAIPREDEIAKLPYYQVNLNGFQADLFEGQPHAGLGPRQTMSRCGFIRDGYVYLRVSTKATDPSVKTVRGFQMSGDRSFCVAGVATHNTSINLGEWKDDIQEQIRRWRFDNNYIPILPLPIGNQTIGGDGRALLLGQEIRVWSEQIVTGMGFPQELVFGGLNYSGSNVSLRMLENIFIGYMTDHTLLMNWVARRVASYMDWDPVSIQFKPFKMADDLQRKAYNFQLNQAGKISDDTLIEDSDFDPDKEDKKIEKETDKRTEAQTKAQLAQAEIQGRSQLVMMRYQIKAQEQQRQMMGAGASAPGEPGAEAEGVQQGDQTQPIGAAQAQPLPGGQQQQQQPPPMMAQQQQPEPPQAIGDTQSQLNQSQQIPEGAANVDLLYQAQQVATQLVQMDENSRLMALMNLRQQSPDFYQVVLGIMQQLMSGGGPEPAAEPLPEQQLPQRGAGSALI
jgi:hypothetical protein